MELNEEQRQAVETALEVAHEAGHMALIGPAGTGKTTTIRAIAHRIACEFSRKKVLLLAPTHKAKRQFRAAALPPGIKCWTVAYFCRVSPDESWRDQKRFSSKFNNELKTIEQVGKEFAFVIVDEASMVDRHLSGIILDICSSAGVGVMFSGDPYQLPPVSNEQGTESAEKEGTDATPEELQPVMAPEFIAAPVIARLETVMRHDGPILTFATNIRKNWSTLHGFPGSQHVTVDSSILISHNPARDFIACFIDVLASCGENWSGLYVKAPRALCHQNTTVAQLTRDLRQEIYGDSANEGWQKGELITFPDRTVAGDKYIDSSTDAVVVSSRIVDYGPQEKTIPYSTSTRQELKEISFSFPGVFQELTVAEINPDGSEAPWGHRVVITPLCGDREIRKLYAEARQKLNARRLPPNHAGYKWLEWFNDTYLTRVHSAFVMTVHKSQGSTFEDVYVSRDLLFKDKREDRNPLLYVAATRASRSITFSGGRSNG